MTFLDSSVIINLVEGVLYTVKKMEQFDAPYLTSTICIFEELNGKLGPGETDIAGARNDFGGVKSLDLAKDIAQEAARMQDQLLTDGERLSPRDILIAATARSTGDELVVADKDFETRPTYFLSNGCVSLV
jgi:predicted nucleic acid-binding protein